MTDRSSRDFASFEELCAELVRTPRRWLVSGGAGFIGSNLVETLLTLDQEVVCLDNFATGHHRNLHEVEALVGPARWRRFTLVEGDIRNLETCRKAVDGAGIVLHQAALGSVPRSIADPLTSNDVNVSGFLNMMVAARDAGVESFVYAASSSTYGDHEALPKIEARIGAPMSPYAVTKYVNELYASVFARAYGFEATGLRYFNVFGRRQDPNGAYAAVIPKWTAALVQNDTVYVNGDGDTSRDFCYIDNAVQANIRAALAPAEARGEVFNVAVGDRTDLNTLIATLRGGLAKIGIQSRSEIVYRDFRAGDVRHSQADISKAARLLGYAPSHRIADGLNEAIPWYVRFFSEQKVA